MDWTFVYLMIVLKIPILLLLWIVWWSTRSTDDTSGDDDGGIRRKRPHHPRPPLPRTPRRGPHGGDQLAPPRRVRSVVARSREADHA